MEKTRLFWSVTILIFLFLSISSCSKFRKIQKNPDWRVKYEAALKYYEEKEYYKTSVLLEEILPIIRGSKEAELGQFYFAYSYYYQRQYILAAHHFESFFTVYSRSDKAKEAMFMHAYSLYEESPISTLDQTSTFEAVQAMQNFLNRFPDTEFREDASSIIDELQRKLEKKAFANAKQYHKLGRYKAAIVAFENFKKDFPDSNRIEEIEFLEIDSQYKLAERSIFSKKKERYRETVEKYQEFVDNYPTSEFLKEAENIYEGSLDQLNKLASSDSF